MNWKLINNRLVKTCQLAGLTELEEKLLALALIGDAHRHHADFTVFDQNKIRFELWTNSKNSVTAADYKMADIIDQLFG